jgi:Tol biopolymer transport system component
MGEIFKAQDKRLNRFVAVKILTTGRADTEHRRRFLQEAQAASALNHPNIITIFDVGTDNGRDFIVMEYLDGTTLDRLIPKNGLPLPKALGFAAAIADALAAAHRAGIIHRDLKPANVMITSSGAVKVLDFGVAKLLEPSESGGTTIAATQEGTTVGTPAYMSPEQAEGGRLDARSDIFSFGSVLYEMVTGRRPFTGDSRLSILTKILKEDPTPPNQLGTAIPLELEKIILRCLRKDSARRYQTMADLKVALEDVVEELGAGRQVRQAPSWRRWAWATLVPVGLVAGYFAWRAWRAPETTEPLRAVALTTFPGVQRDPSFSPDGNHIVFTWTGPRQDNTDIYVQQIGSGSPLRLTSDPRADYNPVWSPDGRWIAFLRGESTPRVGVAGQNELRLIPPLGGTERKLADIRARTLVSNPGFLTWCPDSSCLVVTDSPGEARADALFAVSLETGEKRQLTHPSSPALGDTNPAVCPDGRSLVFRRNLAFASGELHWLPLGPGLAAAAEPSRLTPAALDAAYPTWVPDGKEILFSARGTLWRLAIAGGKPDESSPMRLPFVGEDGSMPVVSRPQPSRPSRLVYVHSFRDLNIWRVETTTPGLPSSVPPAVAIASTRWDHNAEFSPDGHRVAFQSNRSGQMEIWLADRDGSNAVALTSMDAPITAHPRWSPDGQTIAFDSNQEGQYELYVIPASGGRPRRLTSDPASDHYPSFSGDGRWIYFASNRSGGHQIWKMPASGGDACQLTRDGGYVAVESLNGACVYYTASPGNTPSPLWRLPVAGGQPVKVLDTVAQRAFALVERGIYYIHEPGGEARLEFFDIVTGRSATVARNLGPVTYGLTASPDGRTILYSREDSSVDDLMLVENFR